LYAVGVTPEIRTYRPIVNPVEDVTVNTVDAAFDAAVIVVEIGVEKSKLIA